MIALKFSGYPFPRLSFQHQLQIENNYCHSQFTYRLIGRIAYVKVKESVEENQLLQYLSFPSAKCEQSSHSPSYYLKNNNIRFALCTKEDVLVDVKWT